MNKIDVIQWKEFKLSSMFDICYGTFVPKKDRGTKTPFITTSSENNGISYYVDSDPMFKGDALTVASDGSVGATFYHDKPFSAGNIAVVLEPHDDIRVRWTPKSALFIATCIRKYAQIRHSWTDKYSVNRVRDTMLPLPVDSSGNPDWQYMDSYIAKRAALAHKYVSELKSTKNQRQPLKISGWQEYKLTDLFTGYDCLIARGQRIKQQDRVSGTIPLVTAGMENQGVADVIADNGVNILYPADSITIDMFGNTFCHNRPFYADDNILILHNSKYNYNELLFIAAVVNKTARQMSSYKSQFRMNSLNKLTIKLPALADGTPDWATMRKRVADLAALSHRNVTSLDPAKLPIFVGDWQEFKICQLFDINKGHRLTKANMIPGKINYIGASADNNGVTHHIGNKDHVFNAGSITVTYNGSVGQVFYQNEPFWATDDVNVLTLKEDQSVNVKLFLMSCLRQSGKRYGFADKWTVSKMKKDVIKLPVDINGNPDWQYMNKHVTLLQQRVQHQLCQYRLVV